MLVRYLTSPEVGKGAVGCPESLAEQRGAAEELLPPAPGTMKLAPASECRGRGGWRAPGRGGVGILEPAAEVVSFAVVDVDGVGRRALFGVGLGGRRGGLYPLATGESGRDVPRGGPGHRDREGDDADLEQRRARVLARAQAHPLTEPWPVGRRRVKAPTVVALSTKPPSAATLSRA